MRSKGFEGMVCSIAQVLAAIGDRWGLLILRDLVLGIHRYDDFRRSSGITNATLSDRLKHLEAGGLIERQRYQTSPDRFEYVLTGKGRDLVPLMPLLAQIGDGWNASDDTGAPLVFTNRHTGAPVRSAMVDEQTGEALDLQDIAIGEGPGADDVMRWRLAQLGNRHGAPHP